MAIEWTNNEQYLMGNFKNSVLTDKIYGFDLDDTIITTRSKSKFAKNKDDWKFTNDNIIIGFKMLAQEYSIVIFTNQKGLSTGKQNIDEWKLKLEDVCNQLNVPIMIYAATHDNTFRKPLPTFWKMLKYDPTNSFYCGDAAGRKKDFSDSDLKFALNGRVTFLLPEDLFKNIPPTVLPVSYPEIFFEHDNKYQFQPRDNDFIIMVGLPGCGKSSLTKFIIANYNYSSVNQDTLKTRVRCLKETANLCKKKLNIIIDNTNITNKTREEYEKIANDYGYNIRYIVFNTPKEICRHFNYHRYYMSSLANEQINLVPELVYRKFEKSYEEPKGDVEFVNYSFNENLCNKNDFYYYF